MPILFFLLFIVLPFIELTLLLRLGAEIGAVNTIGVIVATGLLGGYLAKREGLSVWTRFQQKLAQGGMPGDELVDGLIILVSGALLITPGVITDVIGLLGLLPPSRHLLKSQIKKRFVLNTATRASGQFRTYRQWSQTDVNQPPPTPRPTAQTSTPADPNSPPAVKRIDITDIVNRSPKSE